ncbi:MAG: nucleotide exchange factor GrpE [Hyphomicrobiaceae bacterium]
MSDEPKMTSSSAAAAAQAARDAAEHDMAETLDHDPGQIPPQQMRMMIEALQKELDQAHARVAAKDAQLEAANDKVLRTYADLDNMRKRVEREKEETAKYAITKFARDVVNVADNFERAIQSVPADAKADNPALVALIDGVTLTEREFLNVLERHGVKRVAPQGEAFNPHHHQAVMETHNPDVPAGTVLQVFQPGYLIDDRVLRPAMVVVAAGGAKAPKPQAKAPDDDEAA